MTEGKKPDFAKADRLNALAHEREEAIRLDPDLTDEERARLMADLARWSFVSLLKTGAYRLVETPSVDAATGQVSGLEIGLQRVPEEGERED